MYENSQSYHAVHNYSFCLLTNRNFTYLSINVFVVCFKFLFIFIGEPRLFDRAQTEASGPLCGVGSLLPPLQMLGIKLGSPDLYGHLLYALRRLDSMFYFLRQGFSL